MQHYYFLMAPSAHPAESRPVVWSVFDRLGRFLGVVEMPPRFTAETITRDQVLGFWTDESDVKHVHIYELVKPESVSVEHADTTR